MLHGSIVAGFINKIGFIYVEHAKFVQVGLNKNMQAGHFAVNGGRNGHVKAFFYHVHFANAFTITNAFGNIIYVAANKYIAVVLERFNGEVVKQSAIYEN